LNKRRLKIFFRFSVNKRFLAFEKIYDWRNIGTYTSLCDVITSFSCMMLNF
jgi:hypothetical protein